MAICVKVITAAMVLTSPSTLLILDCVEMKSNDQPTPIPSEYRPAPVPKAKPKRSTGKEISPPNAPTG